MYAASKHLCPCDPPYKLRPHEMVKEMAWPHPMAISFASVSTLAKANKPSTCTETMALLDAIHINRINDINTNHYNNYVHMNNNSNDNNAISIKTTIIKTFSKTDNNNTKQASLT